MATGNIRVEQERYRNSAQSGCPTSPNSMEKPTLEREGQRPSCPRKQKGRMMTTDRTIGRTVKVKTYQALVELLPETSSYVKSSLGGLYAIAVVNSFVIIPVGSERVVAIVTSLDMAEEAE